MGYKRKAHIVFLSAANRLSLIAEQFANSLGSQWLVGRAAVLAAGSNGTGVIQIMAEVGLSINDEPLPLLDATLLQWADLVVTMDNEARAACPPLPTGVQLRHYPFADPDCAQLTLAECRQIRDQVRARIEGMVGGMKLLQNASAE